MTSLQETTVEPNVLDTILEMATAGRFANKREAREAMEELQGITLAAYFTKEDTQSAIDQWVSEYGKVPADR